MDYDFTVDDYGCPIAMFSAGHEALGSWLSEELAEDQTAIVELLKLIDRLEQGVISQYHIEGNQFQLNLERDQIEVLALALHSEVYEELPEDTNLYDQESQAGCGLQDFKQVLLLWQEFVAFKN